MASFESFMTSVEDFFRSVQGKDTLIEEHNAHIATVIGQIKATVSIKVQLSDAKMLAELEEIEVAANHTDARGTFLVQA